MDAWLGWVTMRGDDTVIDRVMLNPARRTRLHLFRGENPIAARIAACGVVRPRDDDHLGLVREGESRYCARCKATVA